MASKLLLLIVLVFDVIAFGLAVAAERRRSTGTVTPDSEDNYRYCVYNSDIATGYGIGAFFFLLGSQAIIMVGSKCFCCGSPLKPGGSRACAVLLFIICWIISNGLVSPFNRVTFLVAEICLLAGSVRNAYHTKYTKMFFENPPSCETVRKGVFAAGAAFVVFTSISSEFYYLSYSKARGSFSPFGDEAGVGMGAYK
ncbi:hypothetical protein M569_08651 [Genlisea aurea]|uniref:Fiber protein Fb34 n=1 Tax=Genlisea aurea TaxID=192259 RepID=S8E1E3_9LAMI|nr:hypothetical protein M569_08651 [Genlisea aurea]